MTVSDVQRALLATGRWAWLGDVIDRWYADPLSAVDGGSPEEIAAAAQRVGGALPVGVVEWFTLVGRRLRAVQDAAATPGTVRGHDDGVVVWTENQGAWRLVTRPDGACVVDDENFPFPPTPLAQALHGMVLSDTLVGVWTGTRIGPLGRLAPDVRGGTVEDADAEDVAAVTAYPELAVPGNPYWGTPPRGDADTVVRGDEHSGPGLEWMTASRTAFDRLAGLVVLDPPGGPHELVVAFEQLTHTERATLLHDQGVPDTEPFATAVRDLGRLWMGTSTASGIRFHITTNRPDETATALRGAIPAELAGKVVMATRPVRISSFRVLHPAGRDEYVLPD